jgi:2-dehydro-3-deoxy-D-arabinonate dehydratase
MEIVQIFGIVVAAVVILVIAYLYRETSFPLGCVLLTGTGIVPPAEFALRPGDEIEIHVPPIGTLRNPVA